MPLNPPSYKGQDVWFSPDVFINKSEAALWQPPWPREGVTPPSIGPIITGDDIIADGSVTSQLNAQTYLQNLVQQGAMTPEQAVFVENAKASPNDPSNDTIPAEPGKIISNDTGGIENLKEFPLNLPLSRHYTLGKLTQKPWVIFDYKIPPEGINGLTAGQIVANLKLLAVNVLDRIKDKYPNALITNTFRSNKGEGQHGLGQAADIQFLPRPFSQYYDIAIWIKDNIPFDQLILEYGTGRNGYTCWIHVSYATTLRPYPKTPVPPGIRPKIGTLVAPSTWINRSGFTNYASNLGLA